MDRCLGVNAPLRRLDGSNVMLLSLRLQNPLDVDDTSVGAVEVVLVVSSSRRMWLWARCEKAKRRPATLSLSFCFWNGPLVDAAPAVGLVLLWLLRLVLMFDGGAFCVGSPFGFEIATTDVGGGGGPAEDDDRILSTMMTGTGERREGCGGGCDFSSCCRSFIVIALVDGLFFWNSMYVFQFSIDLFGNHQYTSTYEVKVFASTHESQKAKGVVSLCRGAIVADCLDYGQEGGREVEKVFDCRCTEYLLC